MEIAEFGTDTEGALETEKGKKSETSKELRAVWCAQVALMDLCATHRDQRENWHPCYREVVDRRVELFRKYKVQRPTVVLAAVRV
mmetsp:Transcript_100016/g.320841  ORF Transcript_100016/g.320841 Transcript_100016/m.320841 type:complete len:85 (+) Transcript_100016:1-255(+)